MSQQLRLEGKVAIITGAASGIGEAAAKVFVEHGACVVIADIQDELGNKVVESIGSDKVCYKHCDVTDETQVEETVAYAIEKYGSLDIMYSNAGIMGPIGSILDLDVDKYENTMAINLRGAVLAIKHAGRAMVANKTVNGSIICTGSVASTLGGSGPPSYTISKHGLIGLVRAASSELGKHGIRVNSISPYGVTTPMSAANFHNMDPIKLRAVSAHLTNLKGIVLETKHVAQAALFLASNDSVYVSGHNLAVDGGVTVVSNILSMIRD